MTKIVKCDVDLFINQLLFQNDHVPQDTTVRACYIDMEQDHNKKERRIMQYSKKRELCLRLLTDTKLHIPGAHQLKHSPSRGSHFHYEIRDLTRRLDEELVPGEVLNLLKYLKLFQIKKAKFLPHYSQPRRIGMKAEVPVERMEQTLRDSIGDR